MSVFRFSPWLGELFQSPSEEIQARMATGRTPVVLSIVFWFAYGTVLATTTYAVLSSSNYLERAYEHALDRAESAEDREAVERAYDSTIRVVRNPGWRAAASAWTSLHGLGASFALVVLVWLTLSLMAGRWNTLPFLCYCFGASSLLLMFGTCVHSVGNLLTSDESFRVALTLVVPVPTHELLRKLLHENDLFTVAALWFFSLRIARYYGESRFALFLLVLCLWLALLLIGHIVKAIVFLTL